MAIFDFGHKQRMHTQLVGNTSGREMFKVDEYNQVKKTTVVLGTIIAIILTLFYFSWADIPSKIKGFMFIVLIVCGVWTYFNVNHQIKVRNSLY